MVKSELEPGMKVHYVPMQIVEKDCITTSGNCPNGMVKSLTETSEYHCHVVYNCKGDWENYKKYTGILTRITDLRKGWL